MKILVHLVLILILSAAAIMICSFSVAAQGGHGPAFGLTTPTGGKGGVSYNATLMSIRQNNPTVMMRHTWNYSLTERLQFNFSTPTPIVSANRRPRTRGGSMMPGFGDIELSAFYRFHQNNLNVGSRFESTLIAGVSYPVDEKRGGINPGSGLHLAAVTGYASRSWYLWGGGGWQYYMEKDGEQLGHVIYTTGVIAYRPRYFRENLPNHDWRIFVEGVSEWTGQDRSSVETVSDSDNHKILIGPSLLGLYGSWGISAGILFPIYEMAEPIAGSLISNEAPRVLLNLSYWFF